MNMIFNDIEITEDDIRYAEEILFSKTNIFDKEERIPIIENFNKSFDVNACPGSGKTTVLLAKLIISGYILHKFLYSSWPPLYVCKTSNLSLKTIFV